MSGLPLSIESSIGYVLSPDDGIDVDDLLQHADVAMYVAKAQHTGVVRYDAQPRPLRRGQPGAHRRAAPRHRRRRARRALPAQGRPRRRTGRGGRGAGALAAPHARPALPRPLHPHVRADRPHRQAHEVGHAHRPDRRPRPRGRVGVGQRLGPHPRAGPLRRAGHRRPRRSRRLAATPDHRDHRDRPAHRPASGRRRSWPSSTRSGCG